jgi:hypothetical protein
MFTFEDWLHSKYPFELNLTCGTCLTMHLDKCSHPGHRQFVEAVQRRVPIDWRERMNELTVTFLELRTEFAHLYEPKVPVGVNTDEKTDNQLETVTIEST